MNEAMQSVSESDWWATGPGHTMCPFCGDERQVHQVGTGSGVINFCQTCGKDWPIHGPLTRAQYMEKYMTRKTDVQGHMIRE